MKKIKKPIILMIMIMFVIANLNTTNSIIQNGLSIVYDKTYETGNKIPSIFEYTSEFNFENEIVGNTPSGFTISRPNNCKITESMGNHSKPMKIDSIAGINNVYSKFTNKTEGTIEFYILVSTLADGIILFQVDDWATGKHAVLGSLYSGILHILSNGIYVSTGVYMNPNQWYHIKLAIRIPYNNVKVTINNILRYNGRLANELSTVFSIFTIICNTVFDYVYMDNLDYSWSPNYYNNRNVLEFKAKGIEIYPSNLNSLYSLGNTIQYIATDSEKYQNVWFQTPPRQDNNLTISYSQPTFELTKDLTDTWISTTQWNYESMLPYPSITLQKTNGLSLNLGIDMDSIKNDLTFEIEFSFFLIDSTSQNYDYTQLLIGGLDKSILINITENEIKIWNQFFDSFETYSTQSLKYLSLQYALNFNQNPYSPTVTSRYEKLDIQYSDTYFNNSLIVGGRLAETELVSNNQSVIFHYLNTRLTRSSDEISFVKYSLLASQILGYDKQRNMYGFVDIIYPIFAYNLDSDLQNANSGILPYPDEIPTLDLPYWGYTSFIIATDYNKSIEFNQTYNSINKTDNTTILNEFSFQYNVSHLKIDSIENKFYYNTQTIDPNSWGQWSVSFGSLGSINFNWFRDGLVLLINGIVFMLQAILYLIVLGLNYLIVWIFMAIIVILWNYPIYWIMIGLSGIIFYICFAFVWLWYNLAEIFGWLWEKILWLATWLWQVIIEPIFLWIYNSIILPIWNWISDLFISIYNWLVEGGFWIIWDWIFVAISHILAIFLFILSFGTVSYNQIQQSILQIMRNINSGISEFVTIFFGNFVLFIGFSATYILLIGLIYIKYIFARSKGHLNRANKLEVMIKVYIIPINLIIMLAAKIIAFVRVKPETDKGGK